MANNKQITTTSYNKLELIFEDDMTELLEMRNDAVAEFKQAMKDPRGITLFISNCSGHEGPTRDYFIYEYSGHEGPMRDYFIYEYSGHEGPMRDYFIH